MSADTRGATKSAPLAARRGSRRLWTLDTAQPTYHVIASVSKANNSWTETQRGERKDNVKEGAMRQSPRPDADSHWERRSAYEKTRYRQKGTTMRDSYVNDTTSTNIVKRDWKLRYCAGNNAAYDEAHPNTRSFPPASFGHKPVHHTARHDAVGVLPRLDAHAANRQTTVGQGGRFY